LHDAVSMHIRLIKMIYILVFSVTWNTRTTLCGAIVDQTEVSTLNSSLVFGRVDRDKHQGNYSCDARNALGTGKSNVFFLSVQSKCFGSSLFLPIATDLIDENCNLSASFLEIFFVIISIFLLLFLPPFTSPTLFRTLKITHRLVRLPLSHMTFHYIVPAVIFAFLSW
jgi:hypothetical protein